MKKPLAVVTMVKGDYHWATIWRQHYGAEVQDPADMHIIVDGSDPQLSEIFEGCTVIESFDVHHDQRFETSRLKVKHDLVRALLADYHSVLMIDIDEFVCVDPDIGRSLADHLIAARGVEKVRSSFGIEVFHWGNEPALDLGQPILSQRKYGYVSPAYCKPNAFFKDFGSANHHRIRNEPWVIDPALWMFHMRYVDRGLTRKYAEDRKAEYAKQLDADGSIGGAKSWGAPMVHYRKAKKRLKEGPEPAPLTAEIQAERIKIMLDFYNKHNRVGRGHTSSPLYILPQRFANSI